jgi:hypothetical protein
LYFIKTDEKLLNTTSLPQATFPVMSSYGPGWHLMPQSFPVTQQLTPAHPGGTNIKMGLGTRTSDGSNDSRTVTTKRIRDSAVFSFVPHKFHHMNFTTLMLTFVARMQNVPTKSKQLKRQIIMLPLT